ncbi:MAG: hypothetical protein HYS27_13635 [Deltaproteobacteria bacterium]|nr:hypothetical protein [Deltaproteobacteria bacterium]
MKLNPGSWFSKNAADARAQNAAKKQSTKNKVGVGGADLPAIRDDEDLIDTGSGDSGAKKKQQLGGEPSFAAATHSSIEGKAHIINKGALEQQAMAGPGSLDPSTLGPPTAPDARRWLAKRGVELQLPEGWKYLGQQRDGRSVAFHSSGTSDGHGVEVSFFSLRADVPLDKIAHSYTAEDLDELIGLGRLSSSSELKVGEVDGLLLVGYGPDSKDALDRLVVEKGAEATNEALYLATDGTGLRSMSWRGAVKRGDENQLVIISFTSPVESFHEARAAYDAILAKAIVTR